RSEDRSGGGLVVEGRTAGIDASAFQHHLVGGGIGLCQERDGVVGDRLVPAVDVAIVGEYADLQPTAAQIDTALPHLRIGQRIVGNDTGRTGLCGRAA